jgi:hypothetical protein
LVVERLEKPVVKVKIGKVVEGYSKEKRLVGKPEQLAERQARLVKVEVSPAATGKTFPNSRVKINPEQKQERVCRRSGSTGCDAPLREPVVENMYSENMRIGPQTATVLQCIVHCRSGAKWWGL